MIPPNQQAGVVVGRPFLVSTDRAAGQIGAVGKPSRQAKGSVDVDAAGMASWWQVGGHQTPIDVLNNQSSC